MAFERQNGREHQDESKTSAILALLEKSSIAGEFVNEAGARIALRPDGTAEIPDELAEPPDDDDYSSNGVKWSLCHEGGQTSVSLEYKFYMEPMEQRYRSYMPSESTVSSLRPLRLGSDGTLGFLHGEAGWFIRQSLLDLTAIANGAGVTLPEPIEDTTAKAPIVLLDFDLDFSGRANQPQLRAGTYTAEQVRGQYRNRDGQQISLNEDGTAQIPEEWTKGRCAEDYNFDRCVWSLSGAENASLDMTLEYSIGIMEHRYVSYMPRATAVRLSAALEYDSYGLLEICPPGESRFVQFSDASSGTA